ncbi:hypothetical protein B0O99DRAFT_513699, partial [Bisporella sp. PMI_857]
SIYDTCGHGLRRTGHPVRSAIYKPQTDRLVVEWVATSESLLLYVLHSGFFFFFLGYLRRPTWIESGLQSQRALRLGHEYTIANCGVRRRFNTFVLMSYGALLC